MARDELDDGFIEEEWQFVSASHDEDDDEDADSVVRPGANFDIDDGDDDEEPDDSADSGDFGWDAGVPDEDESEDENEFAGWNEKSPELDDIDEG